MRAVPTSGPKLGSTAISSSAVVYCPAVELPSRTPSRSPCPASWTSHRLTVIAKQKGNLTDDLLDYVTAGPKMRKWYGQADREELETRRRGEDPDQQQEEEEEGDGAAILVTDADTPIGEQVVLQLILAGAEIRILVKDTVAAKTSYGPYVTPLSLDTSNAALLKRVLKGCGSVVCLGRPGALPQAAKEAGIAHVLLLSAAGNQAQGGFLGSLFDRELSDLRNPEREAQVMAMERRHTIVRVGAVKDTPGGQASITLQPTAPGSPGGVVTDAVSREDLARVVVQALLRPPSTGRVFQVVSTSPGTPPQDWGQLFESLQGTM